MDISTLLPSFQSGVFTILAFIVALSVIVAIHEYGHYIVGRWSGIHADVFSLGFGPVIYSRYDKRGTKWQIAAIPMGGFVKFKGDADAASAGADGELISSLSEDELRSTMHGAPLWARAATVAAGPIFNFALSILIFTGVIFSQGVVGEKLIVGEVREMPFEGITLQEGDVVLAIDGTALPNFDDGEANNTFIQDLPLQGLHDYLVERNGAEVQAVGPHLYPPHVLGLSPQSAAYETGLKAGDVIVGVDGKDVFAFHELKAVVESSEGRTIPLRVWRDGVVSDFDLTPRRVDEPQPDGGFETQWRIGIRGGLAFDPAREAVGVIDAATGAVSQTGRIIQGSLSGLYHMVTGAISSCNLSGPIGIAQTSGAMASQGTDDFIWFIAVLSTAIGLLNLFPIPVLDGGHLVFHAYEAVSGKPPSDGVVKVLMMAGLFIVLSLMIFGVSNDLFCP